MGDFVNNEIPLLLLFLYLLNEINMVISYFRKSIVLCDLYWGHCQVGSLTGAVHLSKNNAGVLRPAQREQKSRIEQKGKCWLDLSFQYKCRP